MSFNLPRLVLWLALPILLSACTSAPNRGQTSPSWDLAKKTWVASDGKEMQLDHWNLAQEEAASSVWVAIHGLGGGAEDFSQLEEFFQQRQAILVAPNLRGMGTETEPQQRGDVSSGQEWVNDVIEFITLVRNEWPELPVYLHGESLGAIISIHATAKLAVENQPRGIVLSAPVVFFEGELSPARREFFRLLRHLVPRKRLALSDLGSPQAGERLPPSRDPQVLRALEETPVRVEAYTLRMLFEIVRLMREADIVREQVNVPVLVLYAGKDVFIKPRVLENFLDQWQQHNTRLERRLFPQSHHLITRDLDAPAALDAWSDWWMGL